MPSPRHPCATVGCKTMLARKEAVHCKKHVVHTPEWVENVAKKIRGQKRTPEQREKIRIARTGNGDINRTCPVCNKQFKVSKPSSKTRFCSRTCGYKQRRGASAKNWNPDIPIYTCRVCGNEFRGNAVTVKRFCCSYTCNNIWKLTHQRNKGTNIENIMKDALESHGINYLEQQNLCNTTVVDFFIPTLNTAIFCDGDYWHSLPGKKEHDMKKTKVLIEKGYRVKRFLGSQILRDVEECIKEIKHLSTSCT